MRPDIRRAALQATARIALSVTVAGCQSATVSNTHGTPTDVGPDVAQASDIPASTTPDVAPSCDPGVTTNVSVGCCTAQLDASIGDGGTVTRPDDLACCQYLAVQNDTLFADGGGSFTIPYRSQCCAALHWMGSITCTPWGPPVPPAMHDAMVA